MMPAPLATAAAAGALAASRSRALRWIALGLCALSFLTLTSIIGTVSALVGSPSSTAASGPSAVPGIPAQYLRLYLAAGQQYGIDWAIIAAIGKIESDHGRGEGAGIRSGLNFAGCCAGPMQFYVKGGDSSTWAAYGVDGNGDGRRDPYNPTDAIPAAANYLRASGAPGDYRAAIFAYNHADWYVADVLAQATKYRRAAASSTVARPLQIGGTSARAVLANPRVSLSAQMRSDLSAGRIDPRVIAILSASASRHSITVSSLLRPGDSDSNHSAGRAADISAVDGQPCNGSRQGACGQLAVALAQIRGPLQSTELIYCFDPDGSAGPAFAARDHCDHVHVGWD